MERIRPTAVAVLLCVALLAAACSDDDAGSGADPDVSTTTTLGSDSSSTTAPAAANPPEPSASVAELLAASPRVQDITIHLGMWVERDDAAVPFIDSVVDSMVPAGTAIELDGGMTLQPVAGIDAWTTDAEGAELPGVSAEFALLSVTSGANGALTDELVANAEGEEVEDFIAALTRDETAPRPLLVEIVTAEPNGLNQVGPTDRSVIDITAVDIVSPGDHVALEYLFAQTLPGDPGDENGLSPVALFAHRWGRGLVRFLGDDGVAAPFLDTGVDVRAGSTLMDRLVKAAVLVGLDAAIERPDPRPIWVSLLRNRSTPQPGTTRGVTTFTVPGSDIPGFVEGRQSDGPASYTIRYRGEVFSMRSPAEVEAVIQLLAARARCVVLAAVARQLNAASSSRDPIMDIIDDLPGLRSTGWGGEPPRGVVIRGEDEGPEGPSRPRVRLTPNPYPAEDPPPTGCNEPVPSGGPPPSAGGIAYGDVRITTIDGVVYNNNAAGEFVLYEDGDTAVQMRLEPWGDGVIGVSVATAAALEVDGHVVSLHLDGAAWIDGEPAELARGEPVTLGSGELVWFGDNWLALTPDGTLIRVQQNLFSLVITVDPPVDSGGESVGLFGNGDGDPEGDLVRRDGTPFDGDPLRDFDRVYPEFIETWRITADESLFHYDGDESTETFTIDGFPQDPAVIDSLSEDDRAFGEAACRNAGVVVDGWLFDACVIDVAVTGEPALALDSFDALLTTVERHTARTADPADVPAATPGDTVLTISDETLIFGEDPPNQRPNGVAPSWSCEVRDGNLFADGSIDLADGDRYAISVQYFADEPRFSLTVRRGTDDYAWVLTNVAHFADAVRDMTLDGTRLAASGELYVNDPPELGLAPFSLLPDGATLDPFTLDLECTP